MEFTLAASQTTKPVLCNAEHFVFYVSGDLGASGTLTVQCSTDGGANWFTYVADDASGTPTDQTFTITHVTAATKKYSRILIGRGAQFRVAADANITDAKVAFRGEYIHEVISADGVGSD